MRATGLGEVSDDTIADFLGNKLGVSAVELFRSHRSSPTSISLDVRSSFLVVVVLGLDGQLQIMCRNTKVEETER